MFSKQIDHDVDRRLSTLVDAVSQLALTVNKISTKHDFLTENHNDLVKKVDSNADSLAKKVDKNTDEIRNLQTMHTEVKTVSNLARYGGIALITAICAGWNSLSTKVEGVTAKTDNNAQNIAYLQKDNLDDQKQLDALTAKVAENRENILTQLKDKQDKK